MSINQRLSDKLPRRKTICQDILSHGRREDPVGCIKPRHALSAPLNLEYLAQVVQTKSVDGETVAFPDSLVGTDSHTTMINGLGVLGWGVGGIEAETAMLGQPMYMLAPEVIGVRITGELPEGATATDVVLTVTQMLRARGVVDKFVEYFGPGVSQLALADRATIANMAPEYGATAGFFPVDDETLRYLRGTGRPPALVDLVERYTKEQGLFRSTNSADPAFTEVLALDLSTIEPGIAGPKRPQDRVPLREAKRAFWRALPAAYDKHIAPNPKVDAAYIRWLNEDRQAEAVLSTPQPYRRDLYRNYRVAVEVNGEDTHLSHGSVVIAAITSCTNTSNPSVMIGAGLLAKKAVEQGLRIPPYVKTSLAPGSRVVGQYLRVAGLEPYLQALGFHIVGYGCTTCIGNSGPLLDEVAKAIVAHDLIVAGVLSGNRNFEGRIHPLCKANYLASPPLVVAYGLAGTVDFDPESDPIGYTPTGEPVYLRDIWPTQDEIRDTIQQVLRPSLFTNAYANVFEGNTTWNQLAVPKGSLYQWDQHSTYIQELPLFRDFSSDVAPVQDIKSARILAMLGDSVTTDHISPAGSIPLDGPAGHYLRLHNVKQQDFNSFGARWGNHEVMMRGTFANIRLRNKLLPGSEGGVTLHLPAGARRIEDGEQMRIYDAAMQYQKEGTPLVVIAGKEYGTGSSRDWAAKGTALLGVKAVIAESYERIHRSNLVAMGVLPLQFKADENAESCGLTGFENYDIEGINNGLRPGQEVTVRARCADGSEKTFHAIVRINSPVEVKYYRNGGTLQAALREMMQEKG